MKTKKIYTDGTEHVAITTVNNSTGVITKEVDHLKIVCSGTSTRNPYFHTTSLLDLTGYDALVIEYDVIAEGAVTDMSFGAHDTSPSGNPESPFFQSTTFNAELTQRTWGACGLESSLHGLTSLYVMARFSLRDTVDIRVYGIWAVNFSNGLAR